MRSNRGHAVEAIEVGAHVRAAAADDSSRARSSISSIHPARLESGVPNWCADSRAIPAHRRSRAASPRVRTM